MDEQALLWAGLRTTLISHGFTPPIPASCYAPFSKWTKLDDQTLILSVALVLLNRKRRCKDRKSGLSETFQSALAYVGSISDVLLSGEPSK